MDKKGLSIKQLKTLLSKWQKRLLLNDWDLSIKIVEFKRKDYKQSGDIKVYPQKKKAVVLLTKDPFRDEEKVLVHELVHLILYDYDIFCEKLASVDSAARLKGKHGKYMDELESVVDHLTKAIIKNQRNIR